MVMCSFCRENYEPPRGTTVVQKDGTAKYFCSSKCRKNMEMGRISKKVKWIKKSDTLKAERAKKDEFYKAKQAAKKRDEEAKKARKQKKK